MGERRAPRIAITSGGQTQTTSPKFGDAAGSSAQKRRGDIKADGGKSGGGDAASSTVQTDISGCWIGNRSSRCRRRDGRDGTETVVGRSNVAAQFQDAVTGAGCDSGVGCAASIVEGEIAVQGVLAGVGQRAATVEGDVGRRSDLAGIASHCHSGVVDGEIARDDGRTDEAIEGESALIDNRTAGVGVGEHRGIGERVHARSRQSSGGKGERRAGDARNHGAGCDARSADRLTDCEVGRTAHRHHIGSRSGSRGDLQRCENQRHGAGTGRRLGEGDAGSRECGDHRAGGDGGIGRVSRAWHGGGGRNGQHDGRGIGDARNRCADRDAVA